MSKVFRAVKRAVSGVVKAITKVVTGIVNFIGDIVGFVFNPMGSFDVPQPSTAQPDQEAQGVVLTKQGTNQAIPVVYGFRRTGGSLIYLETNGTSNKYLYAVYAVSEGEIEGFKRILVEDRELPLPADNDRYVDGAVITVTSGPFANRIKFQCFNGTETQAQSSLANEAPNWQTKSRKMPGVAYVAVRFEWKEIKTQDDANSNPFAGGIPKITFDIVGKKIFDVRNHTAGNLELANDYANLTKTYSFNPANCLLDYLMNPRYGCGLTKEEINAEAFRIAANKYEETVEYSNTQTGRAMTLNYVVDTNAKLIDNVKILVGGCRGFLPYVEGRYKLKVEDAGNETSISSTSVNIAFDVTKDYVIGGVTLDGERKNSKFNEVIVNYVDPDQNFTNQQVFHTVSGDQALDNNELLRREFNFPTLTNKAIARDIAQLIYKKSRNTKAIKFTGTQELIKLEVGDVIRITDTVLNLSNDTFRVVDIKLNIDLSVDVSAVEHDATIYPFTKGAQIDLPPQIFLPDELFVAPRLQPQNPNPLGITPPNDPDKGSAGQQNNITPAPTNPTLVGVTGFETFADYPSSGFDFNKSTPQGIQTVIVAGGYFMKVNTSAGLLQGHDEGTLNPSSAPTQTTYGITHKVSNQLIQDGYVVFADAEKFINPNTKGLIKFRVRLNPPNNTSFTHCQIRRLDSNGDLIPGGEEQIAVARGKSLQLTNRVNEANGNPTATYIRFRWLKKTSNGFDEIEDASQLGTFFTYYDVTEKKNVTKQNIEALINFNIANPNTLFGITGSNATSGTSSVTTKVNLGG